MGDTDGNTTASGPTWLQREDDAASAAQSFHLVIAWTPSMARVGEVTHLPSDGLDRILGRGNAGADDAYERLAFVRQRPSGVERRPALDLRRMSRNQLRLRATPKCVDVERVGRCRMLVNGLATDRATLQSGDSVLLEDTLLLWCTERPRVMASGRWRRHDEFGFAAADASGIVGESPATWELRERIAFIAGRMEHALILGPSGSGKELAARAIHQLSGRRQLPFVARNAATLPPGLVDAELFGHARDYPNHGMPEREGLLGRAGAGTLFLDEIGDIPMELQAHLLRVLDRDGEYQRLGDSTARRAEARLLGATNRPEQSLRPDMAARFALRLLVPGLDARREDIPLLARHLLRRAAATDARLGEAFFEDWNGETGEPRFDPRLIGRLMRHPYNLHLRELEALLWSAVSSSERYLTVTPELKAKLTLPTSVRPAVTPESIRAALARHDGNRERAFRELGLPSRDALYRLMKKHRIEVGSKG